MVRMCPRPARFDHIPAAEPRLHEGVQLFNAGKYFESHEVWESLWHDVGGVEREFLQGLIQLAAAYYHGVRGNVPGALFLAERARRRLAPWQPMHAGMLVRELLNWLDEDLAHLRERSAPSRRRTILMGR